MASPTLRRDQQTHHAALRFPLPPPPPMAFAAAHSQQWRRPPMAGERLRADPVSRFRSATDLSQSPRACPVLPTIASLLQAGGTGEPHALGRQGERWETRKRRLPEQGQGVRGLHPDRGGVFPIYRDPRPAAPSAGETAASTAAESPRVVMFVRRREGGDGSEEIRVRRPSPPAAALDWEHLTPNPAGIPAVSSAMRRAVYREFGPRGAPAPVAHSEELSDLRSRVRPTPAEIASRYVQVQQPPPPRDAAPTRDPAERCRLYFRHDLDPHKIHEVPGAPRHHDAPLGLLRKHDRTSRYHRQVSPAHTRAAYLDRNEEEMEVRAQKRRRMAPSPTPPPRQPLYESEYGLTVLETSKSLMRARYPASMEAPAGGGGVSASRRCYVRDDANNLEMAGNLPITVESRISHNGGERRLRTSAVAQGTSTPSAPRTQTTVEKREPSPLTTLELKAKEFLKSKSLVRNRHDEIDWVATFLNVGFDSSSIYALMCPLRKDRWKAEEEKYTLGLLRLIESGTILLRHGQSIRGYIGENLHSDDMRVLKKLSNCKMFHFAKLINPRLAEEERLDMSVEGAREGMEQLNQLKGEFLRSVQLEALVAVRRYLSDSTLRDLLNVRA